MKRHLLLFLLINILFCASAANDSILYHETYRPQFHFTPAHRWIGDPCGTIRHDGKYLAYSWGASESDDLIHWREINDHAIKGLPEGIATFTGSVVVDKDNTAGYGNGALIAAFTSFDEATKKQSQSIAFSRDGGMTYQYYDQNPVVDIWSTEFRDPTIIWDPDSKKWIMLVARALEKKVAFYGSNDLKHWEWLSDFGPLGDSERSWECPDMFRLPVEGTDEKKWVLVLSINWAREQYFVGDFDGTRFTADTSIAYPQYIDDGLDYYASRVFQDFDNPDNDDVYTIGWVNTWDYANPAPSRWGKGIWSLPRKLSLYDSGSGLRLRQLPVEAVATLRDGSYSFRRRIKAGTTPLPAVGAMGNVYEMELSLKTDGHDVAGINLCEGAGRRVTLSYDSASGYLVLDRTNSTDADIPKFDRISYLEVPGDPKDLKLHIFVDKSTIEVFVNDGEKVLSLLTFVADDQTAASLFSMHGRTTFDLTCHPLRTIWEG